MLSATKMDPKIHFSSSPVLEMEGAVFETVEKESWGRLYWNKVCIQSDLRVFIVETTV